MRKLSVRVCVAAIACFGSFTLPLWQVALADCPKTGAEWNQFLRKQSDLILELATGKSAPISKCFDQLAPELRECTQNWGTFFENIVKQNGKPGHGMRLEISDDEYFNKAKPYTHGLPQEFLKSEFLESMRVAAEDDPDSFHALETKLAEINETKDDDKKWHFIAFERMPQHPTFRESAGIIHIPAADLPKPARDLFLLFTLKKSKNSPETSDLSVLASLHGDPGKKGTGAIYLEDMHYVGGNFERDQYSPTSVRNNAPCYECHVGGSIVPHPTKIFASFPDNPNVTLENFSKVMRDSKNQNWPTEYSPMGAFGLGTGPVKDLDFIKTRCLKSGVYGDEEKQTEAAKRLQKEMNCTTCHNDKIRPTIYPSPFSNVPTLSFYMHQGFMPLGKKNGTKHQLTEEEKRMNLEIYDCLAQASSDAFVKWLLEKECPDDSGVKKVGTILNDLNAPAKAQDSHCPDGSGANRGPSSIHGKCESPKGGPKGGMSPKNKKPDLDADD